MRTIIFIVCLALSTLSYAKTIKVLGEIKNNTENKEIKLYVFPMSKTGDSSPKQAEIADNKFDIDVDIQEHFISIIAIGSGIQYIYPYYVADDISRVDVSLIFKNGSLTLQAKDKDNIALEQFRDKLVKSSSQIWKEGKDMTDEQIEEILKDLNTTSKALSQQHKCSKEVEEYLKIWSYSTTYEIFESLSFIRGSEISEKLKAIKGELLPSPSTVLDNDISGLFSSSSRIILSSLDKTGEITNRLNSLYENYKNPSIRKITSEIMVKEFISKFNYKKDFEAGLKSLEEVVAKYGLSTKYVNEFNKRKATIVGNPFPEVILHDLNGNVVDFSSFRGKYVYIDLWASWCAPCVREIPHLKELEETLDNEDVILLSISIDTDEKAWKNKVKALDLKGHQLINIKNDLPQALNVSGIPFFIIYDKEGKLYKYGASRPSNPATKEMLRELH